MISDALLLVIAIGICGGGTILLLVLAGKRRLISANHSGVCLFVMIPLLALAWMMIPDFYWKAVWMGFAMLVVTPIPGMPLMIAWNRHR